MFGRVGHLVISLCVGILSVTGREVYAQDQRADPTHGASTTTATVATRYSRADIEHGSRLYAEHCSGCHAASGDGISGVNLRSGQFRRISTDDDLRRIITTGVPGTPMPPGKFSDPELVALLAYVRNMSTFAASSVTLGDPARGKAMFEGKGECLRCHRVFGVGSRVAPDLSDIGLARSAGVLLRTLINPSETMMPVNRPIRAVTRDGRIVNGRRLNEDTFTVQLIDENERLLSLKKADLREYTISKRSSMPSYPGRLTEPELADVVAYLLSLKGTQ